MLFRFGAKQHVEFAKANSRANRRFGATKAPFPSKTKRTTARAVLESGITLRCFALVRSNTPSLRGKLPQNRFVTILLGANCCFGAAKAL